MIVVHTYTVDDVYQLALKIEEGLKFRASRRPNSQLGSTFYNWIASKPLITSSLKTSTNTNGGVNNQQTPNTVNKGGSKGQTPMSTEDRTTLCYKCGGHRHYAVVCPSKGLHFCIEELESKPKSYSKEEETHNEGELSQECDYYDGMSEGHNLVVQPLLAVNGEEDWRRTSIFQKRVSCQGRLCTTIIDGDSNLNIASQELVEKLNLPLKKHPNPFQVAWVNDTSIPISYRCLVTLFFSKDLEEFVWCEVLPIKVSHILLGSPWLFDRRVQHDGYENTYTLIRDGRKKFFVQ